MWLILALVGCTSDGVLMTVDNQSDRTLVAVHYWDNGDFCTNHLEEPLEAGSSTTVRLGSWDEPDNVYRLEGAVDSDGACYSLYAGIASDEAFTLTITEGAFETFPCDCP